MWSVLTFCVGIYVMVLLSRVDSVIDVVCGTNDNITVILNKTANPDVVDGFIAFPGEDNCRSDFVDSGSDTQTASATCFNFTLGQSFVLYVLKNVTVDELADMQTYNVTCETENTTSSVTVEIIDVQPLSFNPRFFGIPNAGVPAFTLGQTVYFGVSVGSNFISTQTIQFDYLRVDTSTGVSTFLIQDGCPKDTPVFVTLDGTPPNQPAHTVSTTFPAYAEFAQATQGVISAVVFYGYSICDINQFPSACFIEDGCPRGDKIGRRRRRDSNPLTSRGGSFPMYIFKTNAEKEAFFRKIIRQELGEEATTTAPVQNRDELCVTNTMVAVSISLLGCAFLFCLLSTIFIATKLYRSEKREHVKFENSNSSVSSYGSKRTKQ